MAGGRPYNETNVTTDTGVIEISPPYGGPPPAGTVETMTDFAVKLKVNTPDGAGVYLATVDWFDGEVRQQYNVQIGPPLIAADYVMSPLQKVWHDRSENFTFRLQPLVAGGSVDCALYFAGNE